MSTRLSGSAPRPSGLPDAGHTLLDFAVSNSPAIFYVASLAGERPVRFISSNVESITGHAPGAFLDDANYGRRHVHPEDVAACERGYQRLLEAGQASREYRFRTAAGRWLWFRDELKLAQGQGPAEGPGEFVGCMIEITAEKEAEAERGRLGRLLDDAVGSLPNGFAVSGPDDRVILCNTAFAAAYDTDAASMIGTHRIDNIRRFIGRLRRFDGEPLSGAEADVQRVAKRLLRVDLGPVEVELDDGRWLLITTQPTADGGVVTIRTDITRQKQAEQALRESEEHFRHIVEHHPLPVFLCDLQSGAILYESPALSALLGARCSAQAPFSSVGDYADPADRRRLLETLQRTGEVRDHELRARLADGSLAWISVSARVIGYRGREVVIASLVDLTERKQAEEALRESETRYRTLVENAPVCIHEIDAAGIICSMNPRGLEMARAPGVSSVVGESYLDLVHEADRERVLGLLRSAFAGERIEFEFRGFTGTRQYYTTKIPVRGESGAVEKLIGIVMDITERKRQEAALQQAHETLEDAIESLPQGFSLWDAQDRLLLCNQRFREFNAATADLLVPGAPRSEFLLAGAERGQYPEAQGRAREWLEELNASLDEFGITREFRQADGRWFQISARRTRQGGIVGLREDITRRKQMEDALRDSEALVRQVLDACPVPVRMTRAADGRVLYESPACRALFGEGTGWAVENFADPAERERYVAALHERGTLDGYEARLRRTDGSGFPGAISARLIRYKGEEVIVSSTFDLTERHAVEEEMRRSRDALHQSEKLSALGQLLASVAHELNNPLSVVVGQALLLRETAADERIGQRAERIGNAADRCARIVKTFLAMARQQSAEMTSVNVNDIVESTLEVMGYGLRSHDIDVRLWLSRRLPPVWGDADQLNQVLTNLLMNAQQALEGRPGPRLIKITTSYRPQSGQVVLKVKDNGPGVAESIRSRIFEPFFTTKEVGSGTGIGLAVCHRVVHSHRGTIKLESTPGEWTAFVVHLPASDAAGTSEQAGGGRRAAVPARRVLVVDDERDVAEMVAEVLRGDGHEVDVAHSGAAALERLAGAEFDAVLSDLRMPGMDGPALHRELCERWPALRGRVAFVTGDTLSAGAREFLATAGCPHAEKPLRPEDIRALVRRVAG